MAGSYDPAHTTVGGLTGELARLDAQAGLSFDEELRIYREVGLAGDGPLVEVGCGPGMMTRRLRAALSGTPVVALDVDPTLLSYVDGPRVAGDGRRLPLRSGCAGGALVRYVLQHLDRPHQLLAEVRRVLRPGGVVAVVDVDSARWGLAEPMYRDGAEVWQRTAEAQRDAGGDRTVGRRLTRLLRGAGFTGVWLRPFAVTSDERPLDDFEPLLGPGRLAPLLHTGALTLSEFGLAARRWQRFRTDPDAWVMLLGLVATGRAP